MSIWRPAFTRFVRRADAVLPPSGAGCLLRAFEIASTFLGKFDRCRLYPSLCGQRERLERNSRNLRHGKNRFLTNCSREGLDGRPKYLKGQSWYDSKPFGSWVSGIGVADQDWNFVKIAENIFGDPFKIQIACNDEQRKTHKALSSSQSGNVGTDGTMKPGPQNFDTPSTDRIEMSRL